MAWGKINPKLKSLAKEDYRRESDLFGPGFLEKASKRLEIDKSRIDYVSASSAPPPKRLKYNNDQSDLQTFLSKGPRTQYSGRRVQKKKQPYNSRRFQSRKCYQSRQKDLKKL